MDVAAGLDVRNRDRAAGGHVGDRRPALLRLAPRAGIGGDVATAVPRSAAHQAPVADAFRRVVGVVEIGEAEEQVPQLVRAHTDARVLRDRQVGEDLLPVRVERRRQRPLVRPDVVGVAGLLAAAARVDDDERVDEAVAVVVVLPEVDGRDRRRRPRPWP